MAGAADKIKGGLKEAAGKATGDRRLETEGQTDQVKGDVKNVVQDVKDSLKGGRDSVRKE